MRAKLKALPPYLWYVPACIIAGAILLGFVVRVYGQPTIPRCDDGEGKAQCWRESKESLLSQDRIVDALTFLSETSNTSPDFINTCHAFAHEVGERAYQDFKAGKTLELSAAMQVCDFGFYHGFMTAFLYESRDFKALGGFCTASSAGEQDGVANFSRAACFHGIGHGSVIRHEVEEWKDPMGVLGQALTTCRESSQNEQDFQYCVGGAYNGMAYGPYHEVMDTSAPFKLCAQLSESDLPQECYANLASVVFNLTPHKTLREAVDLAKSYPDTKYLNRIVPTFANMASRQEGSDEATVTTCLQLEPDLSDVCLRGYITGLVQAATPESKDARAYAFCSSSPMIGEKQNMCFSQAFDTIATFWTTQKIQKSCTRLPKSGALACGEAFAKWSESKQ